MRFRVLTKAVIGSLLGNYLADDDSPIQRKAIDQDKRRLVLLGVVDVSG